MIIEKWGRKIVCVWRRIIFSNLFQQIIELIKLFGFIYYIKIEHENNVSCNPLIQFVYKDTDKDVLYLFTKI